MDVVTDLALSLGDGLESLAGLLEDVVVAGEGGVETEGGGEHWVLVLLVAALDEAAVLLDTAESTLLAVTVGNLVADVVTAVDVESTLGDLIERALDGVRGSMVINNGGGTGLDTSNVEGSRAKIVIDWLKSAVKAPPKAL